MHQILLFWGFKLDPTWSHHLNMRWFEQLQSEKVPKGVVIMVEWRVTHTTFTQETWLCMIFRETKNHWSFPKALPHHLCSQTKVTFHFSHMFCCRKALHMAQRHQRWLYLLRVDEMPRGMINGAAIWWPRMWMCWTFKKYYVRKGGQKTLEYISLHAWLHFWNK